MVTLSEIVNAEPVTAMELRRHWKEERGLSPNTGVPNDVMAYIEQLEAKLTIAMDALRSCATSALGGKAQQYTAQYALATIAALQGEKGTK